MSEYAAFLARKAVAAPMRGMEAVPPLASHLFGYQRDCVEFGLRAGSWGCYLGTGLGKTAVELEWARHAAAASNGLALILTPLAVARQIEAEGRRWGYDARVIREQGGAPASTSATTTDSTSSSPTHSGLSCSMSRASSRRSAVRRRAP